MKRIEAYKIRRGSKVWEAYTWLSHNLEPGDKILVCYKPVDRDRKTAVADFLVVRNHRLINLNHYLMRATGARRDKWWDGILIDRPQTDRALIDLVSSTLFGIPGAIKMERIGERK